MSKTNHPICDREAPDGYEWRAEPEKDEPVWGAWRLASGKKCRCMEHRKACGRPCVAELRRRCGSGFRWWAYCERHMYGRWIENGVIMHWILKKKEASQ